MSGLKITKICLICRKLFKVSPYRDHTAKYCSKRCLWDSNKKLIKYCKSCGLLITFHNGLIANGVLRNWCRICWNKRRKLTRKDRDLYRKKQNKIRYQGYEFKGFKCEECGETNPWVLELHHKTGKERKVDSFRTYKELINNPDDFVLTCSNCHRIRNYMDGTYK